VIDFVKPLYHPVIWDFTKSAYLTWRHVNKQITWYRSSWWICSVNYAFLNDSDL